MFQKIISFFLYNRLVTGILLIGLLVGGWATAPFQDWGSSLQPAPIHVDAIPDLGDNQQIVATEWMGRSPKDVQEQLTYPLTTALLGIQGIKTIRSTSMFGMSFIYLIFKDDIDFYDSRSRILEKLNALPPGTIPEGVKPALGPDATALGQVFWYTLEGRDPQTGKPTGGWTPEELRSVQDFYVRYGLSSSDGVAEVASVGGFIKEYQIDVNPDALQAYQLTLPQVMQAVKNSNLDIGAETVEINSVEYFIRGVGYIRSLADLENSVVAVKNEVPVRIKDIADVHFGPATRRGGLDKEGVEAVGGVVVARYGANPLEVIQQLKHHIEELAPGMPEKTLADGTRSKVTIVPFYDRTGIIKETIGTLESALTHEVLIVVIVILVIVFNLRASLVISALLPIAVLATFIVMKATGLSANIVALSGIAIAIGVVADVGVVLVENIIRHLERTPSQSKNLLPLIAKSTGEVAGAIVTAMLTTVVSFIPVFALQGQEGKLFAPLAFTKTYVLGLSLLIGLAILPTLAYWIFSIRPSDKRVRTSGNLLLLLLGLSLAIFYQQTLPLVLVAVSINNLLRDKWQSNRFHDRVNQVIALFTALIYLTHEWLPLGPSEAFLSNMAFVVLTVGIILALLWALVYYYEPLLKWCLTHRKTFFLIPLTILLSGILTWLGFDTCFRPLTFGYEGIRQTKIWQTATNAFPGMGNEFMPSLNEGSFLLMPTSMPTTGIAENQRIIRTLDRRIAAIPEVERIVGKWGRAQSALDPAPTQMFEHTITYYPEYALDKNGHRQRFKVDDEGRFILKNGGRYQPEKAFRKISPDSLIVDKNGVYLRMWRPQIKRVSDIWEEIVRAAQWPGLTSAPRLQPIEARLVMLTTGLRAPMGVKISGPSLEQIAQAGAQLEKWLKQVPGIRPETVYFDKPIGTPYLEIQLDREAMARYGLQVNNVQNILSAAVGGMPLTTTVEGRERYPVRLRYPRELRDNPQMLSQIRISTATGTRIPLSSIARITYEKGAQMIQSENTFLTGYITFDKVEEKAEVDVVEEASHFLQTRLADHSLRLPQGITYRFAGNYEQQARATQRLLIIVPLVLLTVLLILYFQFRSVTASFIHFSGVFVAFAGGFLFLGLYQTSWFLDFNFAGINLRDLFQIHPIHLSVAVWVGFIALFGIATDDGVLMGTYIHQVFRERNPQTVNAIRQAVVEAGLKRVRPAAMTTATTLIALLPVLTSTGKGSEIMIPMALPTFGGMLIQSMTMFVVPVLQCIWREQVLKRELKKQKQSQP